MLISCLYRVSSISVVKKGGVCRVSALQVTSECFTPEAICAHQSGFVKPLILIMR
jgi:hypothetical protein